MSTTSILHGFIPALSLVGDREYLLLVRVFVFIVCITQGHDREQSDDILLYGMTSEGLTTDGAIRSRTPR